MAEQLALDFSSPPKLFSKQQTDEVISDAVFGDLIYAYTRAQALEDGVLVDVSETAREAGFKWPVAVTAAVWALIENITASQSHQDVNGRLWDVLYMAFYAIKLTRNSGTELVYQLIMHHVKNGHMYQNVMLKLVTGPGDDMEPVVTIMLPDED